MDHQDSPKATNIYPVFDTMVARAEREKQLGQRGVVVWLVGLSGSGKSTLARMLERQLYTKYVTQLLDGDNLRTGLNSDLAFSDEDRKENLRRTAEVAKLFSQSGIITVCSFISPTKEARQQVKNILKDDYFEVFINCPFDECARRDVKGIYKKALAGEIKNFTGLDSPFDAPENPDLQLDTHLTSQDECLEKLMEAVLSRTKL